MAHETNKSSNAKYYHRLNQSCEILSVLALVSGAGMLVYGIKGGDALQIVLGMLVLLLALTLFLAAAHCATRAESENHRFCSQSQYLISEHRVATLRALKAPTDVIKFLEHIQSNNPLKYDELASRLDYDLGSERAAEIRGLVLKYTRFEPPDSAP